MQDVKNDTVRNSLWLNGLSAIFLMIMLLFVPPVTAVHAAEEMTRNTLCLQKMPILMNYGLLPRS